MTSDDIISQELAREHADIITNPDWRGKWWVREYDWLRLSVILRQFEGTRWLNADTGEVVIVSIPRYWQFWWRVRRERRRGAQLPRARVL
jgi:hypothetical protein